MKKAKNKKIVDFWNKIKKPLMILSVVGNILFLIFIIVGCVGAHKKATESNAVDLRIHTLRGTTWVMNETLSPNSPRGVPMSTLVNQEESYLLRFEDLPRDTVYLSLTWQFSTRPLEQLLYGTYYGEYGTQGRYNFYQYVRDTWFDTDFLTIRISQEQSPHNKAEDEYLINWFYENGTLVSKVDNSIFTFNKQINYNAPFMAPLDSYFVTTIDSQPVIKTYTFPYFYTNGEFFDTIKVWYLNGAGMRYEESNGEYYTNTNVDSGYYMEMEYINSFTNNSVVVNTRNFDVKSEVALLKGSNWVNIEYSRLLFQDELTSEQRNNLAQFNNENYLNGFSGTDNVGLGNVFNLLGGTFSALTGLLAIEVLPNITIGLLVFLPLVVMIILAVIWIIKR